jgi:hypothetical protein
MTVIIQHSNTLNNHANSIRRTQPTTRSVNEGEEEDGAGEEEEEEDEEEGNIEK